MKTCTIAVALAVLAPPALLVAQEPPAKARDAEAKPKTPLQRLLSAPEEERPDALIAYIRDQVDTGALYAGQYRDLRPLGAPVVELLREWAGEAPPGAGGEAFRRACIRALRDVVDPDEVPEGLTDTLREIAADDFEAGAIRQAAAYALAQLGDRSLVDGFIRRATAMTRAERPAARARGWAALADVHYNLRDYDAAVDAYGELLALHEDGAFSLGESAATIYYNCACSLALAGKTEEALAKVEQALEAGKRTGRQLGRRLLETDMDIASLRGDPRLAELVERYFGDRPDEKPDRDRR